MRSNSLRALIAANRGKGSPLAVQVDGDHATIEIYDFIVTSSADVDWYGGGVAADAFAREMRQLNVGTIHLRINSPGGDVFGGVAMAQAIREQAATVIAHVDGYAASIASLLTVASDEAVIAPGGMVMIHKAWTIALGNADDMRAQAELLEKIDGDLAAAYALKAGDADWLAAMASETWYTADEAVTAKLVDGIATGAAKTKARAFDLSAYAHAPKDDAVARAAAEEAARVAEAARLQAERDAANEVAGLAAQHRQRMHALRMRQN